jgi:hypothetical protein
MTDVWQSSPLHKQKQAFNMGIAGLINVLFNFSATIDKFIVQANNLIENFLIFIGQDTTPGVNLSEVLSCHARALIEISYYNLNKLSYYRNTFIQKS